MVDTEALATQQRWIEVANTLALDPYARVRCPEKEDDIVQVQDVIAPDGFHCDRYLTCPTCGARRTVSGIVAIMNPRRDAADLSAAHGNDHICP